MKIVAVCAALMLLASCASRSTTTVGLPATGNEFGGKIPNGFDNMPAAMSSVTAHCAQYGKQGVITSMAVPAEGGTVGFVCR